MPHQSVILPSGSQVCPLQLVREWYRQFLVGCFGDYYVDNFNPIGHRLRSASRDNEFSVIEIKWFGLYQSKGNALRLKEIYRGVA